MTLITPLWTSDNRYEHASKVVKRLSPVLSPPIVYDVGAGLGQMRRAVEDSGLVYTAFDSHPQTHGPLVWDLSDPCPLPPESAGLILLLEVIEHLANPGIGLEHIAAAIAPGGYVLITTPNPRGSRSRFHALFTGFPAFFTQSDLDLNGHFFPVYPHVLEFFLRRYSLQIVEYTMLKAPTSWPAPRLHWRYPLRLVRAATARLVDQLDPSAAGGTYAVLARRPD